MKNRMILVLALLAFFATLPFASAQPVVFTYQGRLISGTNAVTGTYDLKFDLYASGTGGTFLSSFTYQSLNISNGLFTIPIPSDVGYFTGADRWLEIAVSTNRGGAFTTLTPRQWIAPTPYAIYSANAGSAASVAAANITGLMAVTQLPVSVLTNGASGVSINTNDPAGAALRVAGKLVADTIGIGTTNPVDGVLDVEGNTHINDHDIFLRGGSDQGHGLGFRANVNGPFLYGFAGGALGTWANSLNVLTWNSAGNVGIGTNNPQATLDVNGSLRINQGTVFTRVQDGIFTAGSNGAVSKTVTNVFPRAFSNVPTVTATPVCEAGTDVPDTFCLTIRRVTATNVVVNIYRVDTSGGWGQNLRVAYHAWE